MNVDDIPAAGLVPCAFSSRTSTVRTHALDYRDRGATQKAWMSGTGPGERRLQQSRPRGLAASTTTMKCAQCGAESPAGMKFCGQCGAPLVSTCPSCGADNPAEHKFCGHCGSLFVSSAPLAVSVVAATTVQIATAMNMATLIGLRSSLA